MKHALIIPVTVLFFMSFNAMADKPYKHDYSNGGHFEGANKAAAIAGQEKTDAAKKENDPYKLVTDSEGNINLNALPPTAAGVKKPEAGPASNE